MIRKEDTEAFQEAMEDHGDPAAGLDDAPPAPAAPEPDPPPADDLQDALPTAAPFGGLGDELILLLWSAPMGAAFIPWTADAVRQGFDTLREHVPDWYGAAWTTMVVALYGVKKGAELIKMHLATRHLLTEAPWQPRR